MSALDSELYRLMRHNAAMARLVHVVQELSLARNMPTIINIVRHAARELTGADGASFVLRDGDQCYYADEDAIAPLWKGKRFPMSTCVSGWCMLNGKSTAIEDVYSDPRVPAAAYRSTFVKSMTMTPIRPAAALGAIGSYWAERHCPTDDEMMLLEALANTTAVAIENVQLAAEQRERLQALKSAQEDARLALEAAQMGRWDYDLRTHTYFWDARCREMFGFGIDPDIELSRDSFMDRVIPADRERVRTTVDAAMQSPQEAVIAMQYQVMRDHDGAYRWIYSTGRAYFEGQQCVRVVGVVEDITDQKRLEEHLRLLVNELNHRVKNSLAVVQAIATQTFRNSSSMPEALDAFSGRIAALAKTHDLLTEDNWSGTHLHDVAELICKTLVGGNLERFWFEGPELRLSPKAAVSLSLALHELATNATKYGALSNDTGRVTLIWELKGAAEDARLCLNWKEEGGPPVKLPLRRGFGLRILERVLPADLGGEVHMSYLVPGIVCAIEAPLRASGVESLHE